MTHNDFLNKRLGKYSDDESITSITEFTVHKHQPRHLVKGGYMSWFLLLLMLQVLFKSKRNTGVLNEAQ